MPALFLNGLIDGQRRFLNCFEYGTVTLMCQVFAVMVQTTCCYVALDKYQLGIEGIGYANTISQGSFYLVLLIYTSCIKRIEKAVEWPDKRAF